MIKTVLLAVSVLLVSFNTSCKRIASNSVASSSASKKDRLASLEFKVVAGPKPLLAYRDSTRDWRTVDALVVLKKGTLSFHWGTAADVERWAKAGRMEQPELDVMLRDPNDAVGGGFYVSLSSIDSQSFGERVVAVEATRDLLVLNLDEFRSDIRQTLDQPDFTPFNMRLAKAGIVGLKYSETWMNFFHTAALERFKEATADDIIKNFKFERNEASSLSDLSDVSLKYPIFSQPEFAKAAPIAAKLLSGVEPSPDFFQEVVLRNIRSRNCLAVGPFSAPIRRLYGARVSESMSIELNTLVDSESLEPRKSHNVPSLEDYFEALYCYQIPNINIGTSQITIPFFGKRVNSATVDSNLIAAYYRFMTDFKNNTLDDASLRFAAAQFYPVWNGLFATAIEAAKGNVLETQKFRDFKERYRTVFAPLANLRQAEALETEQKLFEAYRAKSNVFRYRDFELASAWQVVTPPVVKKLELNPFLSVEKQGAAVRVHFPSAGNFERFQGLLPTNLQSKLMDAKMKSLLQNTKGEHFRSLTAEIVASLFDQILQRSIGLPFVRNREDSEGRFELVASLAPYGYHANDLILLAHLPPYPQAFYDDMEEPIFWHNAERFLLPAFNEDRSEALAFRSIVDFFGPQRSANLFETLDFWIVVGKIGNVAKEREAQFVMDMKAWFRKPEVVKMVEESRFMECREKMEREVVARYRN